MRLPITRLPDVVVPLNSRPSDALPETKLPLKLLSEP